MSSSLTAFAGPRVDPVRPGCQQAAIHAVSDGSLPRASRCRLPACVDRQPAESRFRQRPATDDRPGAPSRLRREAVRRRRASDVNAQISGWRRQVRSRNSPRSGGIVGRSPSRCASADRSAPGRVRALEGLVELLRDRRAERARGAAGDTAMTLASDTWPASSTNSASTAPRIPRAPRATASRRRRRRCPAVERRDGGLVAVEASRRRDVAVSVARPWLLDDAHRDAASAAFRATFVEQVADHLVAVAR